MLNNLTRNPYAAGLAIDGEDGGTGAAYNVSMNHMGHPIASNIRDAYLTLVKLGMQNQLPLFAGGGIGKNGNLAANAAALIMLGASGVQIGKYIMQAAAGCLGSETDRCNICNIGLCPKGITAQDPRLYRRLDVDDVAQRRGGRVPELRHRAQEDRGAPRPLDLAAHRHVRRPGRGRPPHGRAAEHQICGVAGDREADGRSGQNRAGADSRRKQIRITTPGAIEWTSPSKQSNPSTDCRQAGRASACAPASSRSRSRRPSADGHRQLQIEAFGQHGIGGRLWQAGRRDRSPSGSPGTPGSAWAPWGSPTRVIEVLGPASDDVGWLNAGAEIIVHGNAGNGAANAMAQGRVYVGGQHRRPRHDHDQAQPALQPAGALGAGVGRATTSASSWPAASPWSAATRPRRPTTSSATGRWSAWSAARCSSAGPTAASARPTPAWRPSAMRTGTGCSPT
ncbi:MAG: glutamate synthase-related protein [Desulfobacterales bacterium]|nr:glutamate synthase-related protein [Desulfobacterales bacterium]